MKVWEKKRKDTDIKTVLQPNATIGVIIGLICLIMPFRETSKTRKEQEHAERRLSFWVRITNCGVNSEHFLSCHWLSTQFHRPQKGAKKRIRSLGCKVDKFLNGSRVNSHGLFSFGKQSLSLFRGNTAFQQNRRCNFMIKPALFFAIFSYKRTANYEIAS